MKKKMLMVMLVLLVTGMMVWAAGEKESDGTKPVELIFTSVSVPGDSHTEAMYVFADKVEELTGGSVEVKVYDSGTLFTQENEYDALVNGDADMAYISFPTLATQIPSFSMFGSGYFFSSYDHMTSVLNGDIAEEHIWPKVRDLGMQPLGSMYLGSRVINTKDKKIDSYEDMEGVLLRMPGSESWLFLGEALGANPTPLSFSELYTALQTGAVGGQDNPLPTVEKAKFYEVTKYLAITNHVIDSIMPCVNLDKWNSMTAEQQEAVSEAMDYAIAFNDEERIASENSLVEFFEGEGMVVTYPDIAEFRENVQAAYAGNSAMTSTWDMDLYKTVQEMAK
ncbi:MAG: sialic acid TRAP transporter substrate-binding protein SiaP [Sphaerochaetaceae bacterium]|nr:sialic acid TRAP transporter substrate-binding protein SiaP [Sphaerochaetaceae bacterium]